MKCITASRTFRPQLYDPVEFARMLLAIGPALRPWAHRCAEPNPARADWVEAYRFGRRAVWYERPDHRYVRPPVQMPDGRYDGHGGIECVRVLP